MDTKHPLDSATLKALELYVDEVLASNAIQQSHPSDPLYDGQQLWDETLVRPLTIDDLEGSGGVEESYKQSVIPDEAIEMLAQGKAEQLITVLEGRYPGKPKKGGFWHKYRTCPVNPLRLTPNGLQSEHEYFLDGLTPRTGQSVQFRGSVLTPKEAHSVAPRVLSVATWEESPNPKNPEQHERYTQHVRQTLERIELDAGLPGTPTYIQYAARMLLFYALDEAVRGASSVHFDVLLQQWKQNNDYDFLLLWVIKHAQVVAVKNIGDPLTIDDLATSRKELIPVGRNPSFHFFETRGMGEIGTEVSTDLVVRIMEKTLQAFYVQLTLAWMLGEIEPMAMKSAAINAQTRKKFAQ